MPRITVTKEVRDLIRANAEHTLRETGVVQHPNGDYEFPVDDEDYERLLAMQFPGESISDTLVRAFAVLGGKGNN